jgi:hypothetical protein
MYRDLMRLVRIEANRIIGACKRPKLRISEINYLTGSSDHSQGWASRSH